MAAPSRAVHSAPRHAALDRKHQRCRSARAQAYTGLKTLYLEQNAISEIEGLDKLVNLRCLYLGKNLIRSTDGLAALTALDTLDLAENMIPRLTGLACLNNLRTLSLSGNCLSSLEDVRELAGCSALQSLDLSSNRLDSPEIVDFISSLPLLYLKLMGNPCVSKFP
jgi:dynein assembly factor 1